MGIHKTTVLQTTEAVGTIVPGREYRFLISPSWSKLVYLVEFGEATTRKAKVREGDPKRRRRNCRQVEPRAFLHFVPKEKFEEGLLSGGITIKSPAETVPPWLDGMTQEQLDALSERRRTTKQIHEDRIDQRLLVVYEASTQMKELFLADDPMMAINACAKRSQKSMPAARFRFWLFSFLLYGRIGLHYSVAKIGKWDRKLKAEMRPDSTQKVTGARAKKIVDAYVKHRGQGRTREEIYVEAMCKEFGCRSTRDQRRRRKLYHPAGDWFPSVRMFFYHADVALGHNEIVKNRMGEKRHHTEVAPNQGSFTEFVGNAYEWVEYDPFYNKYHPRSTTGHALPLLTVGRMRDAASGAILALSFDLSGETKQQLGDALFCAAVDKVKFCSLFNVKIGHEDWPSVGLPSRLVMDRGAGFTAFERPNDLDRLWPQVTGAPKGVGQAKALIETSHPKKLKNKEGPQHNLSDGNVWQMAMNEILRVKRDNESLDVSSRIPAEWLGSIQRATPNALFQEFDRRGRNDAVQIPFETAVRTFLPLIDISANKDGVWLGKRLYRCLDLLRSGFFDQLARIGSIRLKAHHLRGCVNHLWLVHAGRLFELTLTQKVNNGAGSVAISYDELLIEEEMRRVLSKEVKEHRKGVRAEVNEESDSIVGMSIDAGATRDGRAKRTKESLAEAKDTVDVMRGKL